jgi:protein CpxP
MGQDFPRGVPGNECARVSAALLVPCAIRGFTKLYPPEKCQQSASLTLAAWAIPLANPDEEISMTGQTQSPATDAPATGRRRWRFAAIAALATVALGFTGVIAANAFGPHGGFMRGPCGFMGGPGMMMAPPADADEAAERASWMVNRFARHIDATAEQKTKLKAIVTAAAKDVFPLRGKLIAARREGIELLRQPTVARDKIEALRAAQIANVDAISKRLTQAVGDAAEVLTPEQRKDLADDLSFFARHMHGPRG